MERTTEFVDELREIQRRDQETHPDFFSRMFKDRLQRVFWTQKIAAGCVPHYLYRAKVLNCNPMDTNLKVDFL